MIQKGIIKMNTYNELVMPKNYTVVNEEEMTYVEGGGLYQKAVYQTVKLGVNAVINGLLGGGTFSCVSAAIKSKGKDGLKKAITSALKKWIGARAVNAVGAQVINIIVDLGSWSIGGAVAEALDRLDGDNDNQIYFSRIF